MKQKKQEKRFPICKDFRLSFMKAIVLSGVFCLLVGCSQAFYEYNMDKYIRNVELGMTKKEIISIAGSEYKIVEAVNTDEGTVESLGYKNQDGGLYKLRFVNGFLESILYERPIKYQDVIRTETKPTE